MGKRLTAEKRTLDELVLAEALDSVSVEPGIYIVEVPPTGPANAWRFHDRVIRVVSRALDEEKRRVLIEEQD